jgi:uncharacterized membrane protein
MAEPERTAKRRHFIAWHALLVHFPISLFGAAFLFQLLHFFWYPFCFELATNVTLAAGTASMVPALLTGWRVWKRKYQGRRGTAIVRKIYIGFAMLAASLGLTVWRVIFYAAEEQVPPAGHAVYSILVTLLITGAALEGYYGGPFNHRR